ncbi:MAG: hypothetical protein ACOYW3_08610 [Bacteroidota bacterium]
MENQRLTIGDFILLLLTLLYAMMLGGGMYEQLNITPKIAAAPPQSLAMMQGPYGFNPIKFWVLFRPITILLFVIGLGVNWKNTSRRKLIGVAFLIDSFSTASTFLYFAPETDLITSIPYSTTEVNEVIQARAQRWMNLNWLRIGAFVVAVGLLLISLTRDSRQRHT